MSTDERSASFSLEEPLARFLDRIASEEAGPAGGSVAAIAVAMAAGLVAMAARLAREWPQASEVVERAEALRSTVVVLALADADAYAKVLEAQRLPPGSASREQALAAALSGAADVPLAIAEAASEVATLAAFVAHAGSAPLRAGRGRACRRQPPRRRRCARPAREGARRDGTRGGRACCREALKEITSSGRFRPGFPELGV